MQMTPEEAREFLDTHRLAVLGVNRDGRTPHLTPIYYVRDGDDLLISITGSRAKSKHITKAGRVTLCILHEEFPFQYIALSGLARIEEDGAVDLMARIGERMTGASLAADIRPALEERAKREGRVVLRVTPEEWWQAYPTGMRRRPQQ